jgi:integrase
VSQIVSTKSTPTQPEVSPQVSLQLENGMQIKLNDKAIKAVKAIAKPRELTIAGHPNLVLKAYPASARCTAGTKTFSYRYRTRSGIRRVTIGTYPAVPLHEVRGRYLGYERIRAEGSDPHKEAKNKHQSVAEVTCVAFAEVYMARWAIPRKRTHAEDRRMLNHDIIPHIGSMRIIDITRADIVAVIDRISQRGSPISANRTLALLKRFFGFAIERGVLEHSPCAHVRAPAKENRRDRVLSSEEISAFMLALDQSNISLEVNAALRFLLVSGQRLGEVTSMEWEDIHLANRVWSLPAERSKNGQGHRIPLSARAVLILRELETSGSPTGWVFQNAQGRHVRADSIAQALSRLIKQFNLDHFTPHDLRRTVATQISGMGVDRTTLGRILNHTDRSTTSIYDRYSYEQEVRQALDKWSARLDQILAGEEEITAIRA